MGGRGEQMEGKGGQEGDALLALIAHRGLSTYNVIRFGGFSDPPPPSSAIVSIWLYPLPQLT